jgi:hypothetical protein
VVGRLEDMLRRILLVASVVALVIAFGRLVLHYVVMSEQIWRLVIHVD